MTLQDAFTFAGRLQRVRQIFDCLLVIYLEFTFLDLGRLFNPRICAGGGCGASLGLIYVEFCARCM